jgi:hypothetical protein
MHALRHKSCIKLPQELSHVNPDPMPKELKNRLASQLAPVQELILDGRDLRNPQSALFDVTRHSPLLSYKKNAPITPRSVLASKVA